MIDVWSIPGMRDEYSLEHKIGSVLELVVHVFHQRRRKLSHIFFADDHAALTVVPHQYRRFEIHQRRTDLRYAGASPARAHKLQCVKDETRARIRRERSHFLHDLFYRHTRADSFARFAN